MIDFLPFKHPCVFCYIGHITAVVSVSFQIRTRFSKRLGMKNGLLVVELIEINLLRWISLFYR